MVLTAASLAASLPVRRRRRSSRSARDADSSSSKRNDSEQKRLASTRRTGRMQEVTAAAASSSSMSTQRQKANAAAAAAPGGNKASLGLPSPTGSETSDYQRSTPSPRSNDEPGPLVIDWPGANSGSNGSSREDSDAGFSEDAAGNRVPPLPTLSSSSAEDATSKMVSSSAKSDSLTTRLRCVRRRSTFAGGERTSEVVVVDPTIMLQKVRVALEKIPESKLSECVGVGKVGAKRRHSDGEKAVTDETCAKKLKEDPSARSPLESKLLFTALRKEKLDRILNLKTEDAKFLQNQQQDSKADVLHQADDLKQVANKTDLFLLSQLKQLSKQQREDEEDLLETPSPKKDDYEDVAVTPCIMPPPPPTTIRFPVLTRTPESPGGRARGGGPQQSPQEPASVPCKWEGCGEVSDSTGKLLDHLKSNHADTQNPDDKEDFLYKCMWVGCKVFGRGSSSKSWLSKHVASHTGSKPFQCIVDGCKMRFGTHALLERHVNSHFKEAAKAAKAKAADAASNGGGADSGGGTGGGSGSGEHHGYHPSPPSSAVKMIKKAGKRMKFRKTIFSARIFDLFDLGVMAKVRERLALMRKSEVAGCGTSSGVALFTDRDEVRFRSRVVARRAAAASDSKKAEEASVLLRWTPEDILPDTWCPAKSAQSTRTVPVRSLPPEARVKLSDLIFASGTAVAAAKAETADGASRRKARAPLPSRSRLS